MKKSKVLCCLLLCLFVGSKAFAASATANATATVIAALTITKTADLAFGTAPQSDTAKTIATTDAGAAAFTVTGAPSTAYTITLPANGTVTMITGAGSLATQKIAVSGFVSSPAAGANGMLSSTGTQTLKVGATRAALLSNQVVGSYTTTFTVNVVY